MKYEQLRLFPLEKDSNIKDGSGRRSQGHNDFTVSERMANEFATQDLPFWGCDFDRVYPQIREILPKEAVSFKRFGVDRAIVCEIICAAICHQINWDYLRGQVYKRTCARPIWLSFDNLEVISKDDVWEMLRGYDKPERIRAGERAAILRGVGKWGRESGGVRAVFFKGRDDIWDYDILREHLLSCPVFGSDPQEKKLRLLLQKLSQIGGMEKLASYCQPAIDYHLIRTYVRRGLVYSRTKHGRKYIEDNVSERTEKTVAAIRGHCVRMLEKISVYTGMDINTVNLIEWHIGRSVCTREKADCGLEMEESQWLRPKFDMCPFYRTCVAGSYNRDYLKIKEPRYQGSSY